MGNYITERTENLLKSKAWKVGIQELCPACGFAFEKM